MTTIDDLRNFQSRLLRGIHGIDESDLVRPEREGAWSIRQVIAHLADLELLSAVRLRLMLTDDEPTLPVFARNEWVERLHRGVGVPELLEELWFLRRQNIALLESLTEDDLARRGEHPSYGALTVAELAQRIAEHQEKHLGQIERVKSTLGIAAKGDSIDIRGVRVGVFDEAPLRSPGPGIRIRDLWRGGIRNALHVEIAPGAVWPSIDHHVPGPEEVYVISGEFHDGERTYPAGTFIHNPAGSAHVPQSRTGCELFVYYPEG